MAPSKTQGSKLDLVEQASTYGSYHNHPANRAIHFVFVPLIIYSVFLWLAFLPIPFELPKALVDLAPSVFISNAGLLVAVVWAGYTMVLEPFVGFLLLAGFLTLLGLANVTFAAYGVRQCVYIGLLGHFLGWSMQIAVGHNYFEGRKPALMDSLFQVFVSPFFLVLEALFIFNYRPALYRKVDAAIQKKIAEWKKSQSGKKGK